MDEKGFISIEYLFSLFIILIIASGMLFYTSSTISSNKNVEDNVNHRIILDNVANVISQVNSNGPGYSKHIKLPSDKGYFELAVEKNKIFIEYGDKKGESLLPLVNVDSNYKLISGRSYLISKTDEGKIVIK
ncbi:hypothetical protein [uncultured Methanobrevibacter sp.]|uniref:hypothetical protein n=1 Tax=uncultured Methanobrevibacter sp. TaxID=253161 RepID=UPI0025CE7CCB|nr:hypothetical protein [uncultured Methanobrevibacter sp.]